MPAEPPPQETPLPLTRPAVARIPVEPLERRAYLSAVAPLATAATAAPITFAPAASFVAGSDAVAVAAADLNGDGHVDLAVADAGTDTVNVFFGSGTGTFSAGPVLALSAPPTAILSGDFNGDGKPDLAVAASPGSSNAGTTVTVFLNDGNGTFAGGQVTTVEGGAGSSEPVAIAAGDFNADGHLDLVATDYTDSEVSVLLGTGTGTFAAPVTEPVGADPTAVAVADLNGDGHPDVAVTSTLTAATGTSTSDDGGDGLLVLLGTGTGQFTAGSITPLTASGSSALTAGDLTGDGKAIDLAVGNADGTVSTLVDNGTGTLTVSASPSTAAASTGVAVADLNLDGDGDVVSADGGGTYSAGSATVTVIPGAGLGAVGTAEQVAVGSVPQGLAVADLNGDGLPDVVTVGGGTATVLLNTTAVTPVATATTLAATPASAPAGTAVTLTATVTAKAVSGLTGEAVATGTVDFYDGTTLLGTADVVAGTSAATATVVESALTVGAHRLTAKYQGDVAHAASGSAAVAEAITATATSGPDLVATFTSLALPATVAPGEAGAVKVKLTNRGNAAAAGVVTDALYLSLDTTLDAGDTAVPVKGSLGRAAVKLAPGASATLAGTFTVPAGTPLGSYVLLLDADANAGVAESNDANDVTASPTSYTVADEFGTVGGKRGVTLTMAGATGGPAATFRLAGPGTGTVDVGDDGTDLTLSGTTSATAVTVAGTFTLHDLTAATAIGRVNAATVAVSGGTVTLPGGATAVALGAVAGTALTAGGPVRSLAVASWSGTAADRVTAPSVGTLSAAGAFGPTVTLTGAATAAGAVLLQTFSVGGSDAAVVSAAGPVGTVTVRGGLSGEVNPTGRLAAIKVLGGIAADAGAANVTVGGTASMIGSIATFGPVGTGVLFAAGSFPKRAVLGGAAVSPATDPHFSALLDHVAPVPLG